MSVLATTATLDEISSKLKNAQQVLDGTEFEDMERSFVEDGKTFYVFALHAGLWRSKIETAITDGGHTFQWL